MNDYIFLALVAMAILPALMLVSIIFLLIMSRWFDKEDNKDGSS